jgi:small subunit ribosomal protein S4
LRMGLAASHDGARQLVRHGHVQVNGHRANIPGMVLKPGAVIAVKNNAKSRALAQRGVDATESRSTPAWLTVDSKNFSGEFVRVPTRDEIGPVVDEQLVVELYSK